MTSVGCITVTSSARFAGYVADGGMSPTPADATVRTGMRHSAHATWPPFAGIEGAEVR
jgi:hypothetical protein